MGKYLKLFKNHTQYEQYTSGETAVLPNVSHCIQEAELHYNQPQHDYSQDYFTIEALEDNVDITYGGGILQCLVSASIDNGETWESESEYFTIRLNTGEKLLLKGNNTKYYDYEGESLITSPGRHIIYGNILSLVYGDNFRNNKELPSSGSEEIFSKLFKRNTGLVSAENLILAENNVTYCYANLFYGCTNLVTGPKLPVTTLATGCYGSMFYGCTSLTTAPELPATTLTPQCYQYMFSNCTSLTTAPELPATTLAQACYWQMFRDCTSLTTAPELPATTLVLQCYYDMFSGCTNLNSITCLATDISATNCTTEWVNGVAASGTFTKAASMSSWTTGIGGIPNGWTVENASE